MTVKEITVFIIGLLLVGFLYVMKTSDQLAFFATDEVEEKNIGIDLLPSEKIDTFDPTIKFTQVDSSLDIPAWTFDFAELESSTIEELVDSIQRSIEQQNYFVPENDNALFYLVKLESIDASHEQVPEFKTQLKQELTFQAQLAIENHDEKNLTSLIAKTKTLDKDNPIILQLKKELATITTINNLYEQGLQEINDNMITAENATGAWYTAKQSIELDANNQKAQQLVNKVIDILGNKALRAAEESDFQLAQSYIEQAQLLQPASEKVSTTITQVEWLKQQRFIWLEQQLAIAIDRININRAQRMLTQLADISSDQSQLRGYQDEINRIIVFGKYQPFDVFADRSQNNENLPQMVVMPTGSFVMGSYEGPKHEKPPHTVNIEYGFAVSQNEISVKEFELFITSSNYQTDADKNNTSKIYDIKTGRLRNKNRINWQKDYIGKKAKANDPVIHVSWQDALKYTQWLSDQTGKRYRLLSEAEFEYVMRAGSQSLYPWGNNDPKDIIENLTGKQDKSRDNSRLRWKKGFDKYNDKYWGPAPVGSFIPNPFKLNDTVGNVMEWVADCWHDSYVRAPLNGQAWVNLGCEDRVIRGGSWSSAKNEFLSSHRLKGRVDLTDARLGFRVAVDLIP